MRILITNDDGISAPGLVVAEEIGREIAGPDGEVWIVAPAFEQSGVGHCISYIRPMRIEPLGERRFAVEGSPADCVLAAVCDILAETPPDLILSGVNRGHNVAEDTLYSGTIGGAMEGALHGFRSIALSQYFGKPRPDLDLFAAARAHGADVVRRLMKGASWSKSGYRLFYNVNFPAAQPGEVRGLRATAQGNRPGPTFGTQPHISPNGRRYLWLTHGHGNSDTAPGTDARECHDGYVTVTPLSADLTVRDQLDSLARALA